MTEDDKITHGSGNVFRDLDLPDPETRQKLARLQVAADRLLEQWDDAKRHGPDVRWWSNALGDGIRALRAALQATL